jgi:UDP-3-O-[3-hydroxymyristoyl] glucosamine N-acyltransferase
MRFEKPIPVTTIAQIIGASVFGNKGGSVTGINELHKVEKGDLAFVDHPKYYETCINSAATFIIIDRETDFPEGKALLVVDEPFEAYLKIVNHYRPFSPSMQMISGTASVGRNHHYARCLYREPCKDRQKLHYPSSCYHPGPLYDRG